ncbi:phosphoribosyltransferase family protein [Embleya scabrispora]|uniref:phosphoribosyltransferase family protein n=1 Tax=Embleya scabrispora TaxID=159449 RepID=UPI0019634A2F|nr:phosphoribosyltransferase family protein [Embleya scabrispora]
MTSRQSSVGAIARRLADAFTWRETPWGTFADVSGWWHDPEVLAMLGPGLGALHADARPTLIVGVETRGLVLGPITALHLGVGFVEIRKDRRIVGGGRRPGGDPMLRAATPPEYQDGGLTLVVPSRLFRPGDRVLLVDEWIETGAQAGAVRRMVTEAGAEWIGAAVVVDACAPQVRARLGVRGLLTEDDLPA